MSATATLTKRAATFLGRRTSRRGFIGRSAMVGTALAVGGREFIFKPGSAYAAICNCNGSSCNCGDLCCSGYTEFCCAIYGENTCPPGTLLAGWWKVDGSSFCNGSARYYMDCNDDCGSCGCGPSGLCSGSCTGANCGCRQCGFRRDGCTHFRYGNCNNAVRCVGPIQCRVVTCTKPWELEPSCTTASRVDNATRNHHRPCLEPKAPPPKPTGPDPYGNLDTIRASGRGFRISGTVADNDGRGTRIEVFIDRKPVQRVAATRGGFDITVAWPPGTYEICVFAENVGAGSSSMLGCQTVTRTV